MIVPEDTVKYARKNGAAFYFYLRPLKHCKTNRKCERHTSELQLLACQVEQDVILKCRGPSQTPTLMTEIFQGRRKGHSDVNKGLRITTPQFVSPTIPGNKEKALDYKRVNHHFGFLSLHAHRKQKCYQNIFESEYQNIFVIRISEVFFEDLMLVKCAFIK